MNGRYRHISKHPSSIIYMSIRTRRMKSSTGLLSLGSQVLLNGDILAEAASRMRTQAEVIYVEDALERNWEWSRGQS